MLCCAEIHAIGDVAVHAECDRDGAVSQALLNDSMNVEWSLLMAASVLITAPVMLGGSPLYSFAIAAIAFIFLRGTFNMDEMKAQQEALNREKEAAKASSGQKIRVQRPGR